MENILVDCSRCSHWDLSQRIKGDVCKACNNTQKVFDPKLILCNMCGGPMRPLGTENEQYPHGLEATVHGGYESYHLLDMTEYHFKFCEECLRKMFNQCKIPPQVNDVNFIGDVSSYTYADDKKNYDYRVWKDNGGHHQAYLDKRCNVVQDCTNKAIYTILLGGDFTEDCCCEDHKEIRLFANSRLTKFISNVLKPFL